MRSWIPRRAFSSAFRLLDQRRLRPVAKMLNDQLFFFDMRLTSEVPIPNSSNQHGRSDLNKTHASIAHPVIDHHGFLGGHQRTTTPDLAIGVMGVSTIALIGVCLISFALLARKCHGHRTSAAPPQLPFAIDCRRLSDLGPGHSRNVRSMPSDAEKVETSLDIGESDSFDLRRLSQNTGVTIYSDRSV